MSNYKFWIMYRNLRKYIKEVLSPYYVGMTKTVQPDLQRHLTPIHSQLSGILGSKSKPKIYAACVVIMNDDGKFLGVSRKNDPDRKSTRLNSSHVSESRMPSSA